MSVKEGPQIPDSLYPQHVPPEDEGAQQEASRLEDEGLVPGISDQAREAMMYGQMPPQEKLKPEEDVEAEVTSDQPVDEYEKARHELAIQEAREAEDAQSEVYRDAEDDITPQV